MDNSNTIKNNISETSGETENLSTQDQFCCSKRAQVVTLTTLKAADKGLFTLSENELQYRRLYIYLYYRLSQHVL